MPTTSYSPAASVQRSVAQDSRLLRVTWRRQLFTSIVTRPHVPSIFHTRIDSDFSGTRRFAARPHTFIQHSPPSDSPSSRELPSTRRPSSLDSAKPVQDKRTLYLDRSSFQYSEFSFPRCLVNVQDPLDGGKIESAWFLRTRVLNELRNS